MKLNHFAMDDSVCDGFFLAQISRRSPLFAVVSTYLYTSKKLPPFIYSQFSYCPSYRAFSGYRSWYMVNKNSIPVPFSTNRRCGQESPDKGEDRERNFVTAIHLQKPRPLLLLRPPVNSTLPKANTKTRVPHPTPGQHFGTNIKKKFVKRQKSL